MQSSVICIRHLDERALAKRNNLVAYSCDWPSRKQVMTTVQLVQYLRVTIDLHNPALFFGLAQCSIGETSMNNSALMENKMYQK